MSEHTDAKVDRVTAEADMARPTPGPWRFKRSLTPRDGSYDYAIVADIEGDPQVISEAFGRTAETVWPAALANARLIAAAPVMLSSLKDCRAEVAARIEALTNSDDEQSAWLLGVLDGLTAAIAKAEGRE